MHLLFNFSLLNLLLMNFRCFSLSLLCCMVFQINSHANTFFLVGIAAPSLCTLSFPLFTSALNTSVCGFVAFLFFIINSVSGFFYHSLTFSLSLSLSPCRHLW